MLIIPPHASAARVGAELDPCARDGGPEASRSRRAEPIAPSAALPTEPPQRLSLYLSAGGGLVPGLNPVPRRLAAGKALGCLAGPSLAIELQREEISARRS